MQWDVMTNKSLTALSGVIMIKLDISFLTLTGSSLKLNGKQQQDYGNTRLILEFLLEQNKLQFAISS